MSADRPSAGISRRTALGTAAVCLPGLPALSTRHASCGHLPADPRPPRHWDEPWFRLSAGIQPGQEASADLLLAGHGLLTRHGLRQQHGGGKQ